MVAVTHAWSVPLTRYSENDFRGEYSDGRYKEMCAATHQAMLEELFGVSLQILVLEDLLQVWSSDRKLVLYRSLPGLQMHRCTLQMCHAQCQLQTKTA